MRYWDTSAVLKLYVTEPDSSRFRALAGAGPIFTSSITCSELFVALQRKEAAGDLSPATGEVFFGQFEADVAAGRVIILPTPEKHPRFRALVRDLYRQQPPIQLRTVDALHLCAALLAQATELVTTDKRQSQAAAVFSLRIIS
jgi:predicted nucleic acid-binding protein